MGKHTGTYIVVGIGAAMAGGLFFLIFSKGKIASKVKGWLKPVTGRISSPYGYRVHPTLGTKKFHNGIDIAAPNGTPIKSPRDGVVDKVWTDSVNGKAVRIKLKNGYSAGFAHLSKQNVKEGQKVKRGDVIGAVGSTGRSTGNHLHLTIRNKEGNYVDPQKLIKV